MACDFIPDGYTENIYIAASPGGFYGEHRLTIRPATVQERAPLMENDKDGLRKEYNDAGAALLAKKVVKWDVTDPDGNAVPVTAQNALKLRPFLFERLVNVVAGWVPPDHDPLKPGQPPESGVDKEAREAKNS